MTDQNPSSRVTVVVEDHTGNKKRRARIAADVPIDELIPALITALELPVTDAAGRPTTYHIAINGQQIRGSQTLDEATVVEGAALTIIPEQTAGCFVAGTRIVSGNGDSIPIESLMPGDVVLSCDPCTFVTEPSRISRAFRQPGTHCMVVNGHLHITPSHPVFANGEWKPAGYLEIGDQLRGEGGRSIEITSLVPRQIAEPVYNLHLEGVNHTFFAQGILVHNGMHKATLWSTSAPGRVPPVSGIDGLREDVPGCLLKGSGRKELIEEITAAVEARMLVKLEPELAPEKNETEAKLGLLVRPVFGEPLAESAFRSDVFMMMPFAPVFQTIYEDHVKPVVETAGLRLLRADDFFSQHSIINETWTAIFTCRFAIADCTGRNPNVMYELGIAHTLGKPVIMLSQSADDLPFDIQSRRVILYKDNAAGLKALQGELRRVIGLLIADANTGT